jgi:hypothetical protein
MFMVDSKTFCRLAAGACIAVYCFLRPECSWASPVDEWLDINSPVLSYDLGQSIKTDGSLAAPCFKAPKEERVTHQNSTTNFMVYLEDRELSAAALVKQAMTAKASASGSWGVGSANAEASYNQRSLQSNQTDDKKVTVKVIINAIIGTEYANSIVLTDLGRQYVNKGASFFIENCGYLVAQQIERAIRVEINLDFDFTSTNSREEFSKNISAALGGSYASFNGNASFTQSLDAEASKSASTMTFKATGVVRASDGVTGIPDFIRALDNVQKEPFKSSLAAVASYLEKKVGDAGAANKISFQNSDLFVPRLELVPWNQRTNFAKFIDSEKQRLSVLKRILATRPHYEQELEKPQSVAAAAWHRICRQTGTFITLVPCLSEEWVPRALDRQISHLENILKACLSARKSDQKYCGPIAKYIAIAPTRYNQYWAVTADQMEMKAPYADELMALYNSDYSATDAEFSDRFSQSIDSMKNLDSSGAASDLDQYLSAYARLVDNYYFPGGLIFYYRDQGELHIIDVYEAKSDSSHEVSMTHTAGIEIDHLEIFSEDKNLKVFYKYPYPIFITDGLSLTFNAPEDRSAIYPSILALVSEYEMAKYDISIVGTTATGPERIKFFSNK